MAEALGVAAAIGGFISLAKDVVDMGKESRGYYREIRSANETLSDVILAVEANIQPLRSLQELRGNKIAAEFKATSALAIALYSCQSRLTVLMQKLSDTQQGLGKVRGAATAVKRTLRQLRWSFEADSFSSELDDIRRYSLVFQFALSIDGFSLLSRSARDITDILETQRSLSENYDSLYRAFLIMSSVPVELREMKAWNREQAQKERMEKITQALNWLSQDKMLQKLSEILNHRHGSTGTWIIEQRVVEDWLGGGRDVRTVWCNGDPGIGKTMASAVVMDEIQKRSMHVADGEFGQVFAICDSQNPGTQTARAMLAAITKQLLLCLPDDHCMWVTVLKVFERAARKQQPPSIADIKELLIETAKVFRTIHIVIDGVDEMLDRQECCDMLEHLMAVIKSEVKVALLATSRSNFEDIAHAFRGAE